jgi:superfamily II DNA/RNA helicase
VPTFQFSELPVDKDLHGAIAHKGYKTPTPIQDATIPHILRGKDVVGIANTGTGKTAAFLIPLIQKVRSVRGEQVLIMVPTRELALQIDEELRSLTKGMRIYSVVCVGGMNIGPQLRALRQRNEFVIGTPGRIKDLIDRGALRLDSFKNLVLDEADRMLDMGFIHDMRYIVKEMPKERQTLFFSATFSTDVQRLVGDFLNNPERISVKTRDTSKNIDQDVIHIQPNEVKVDVLHGLLSNPDFDKVLVFGRTKHGVEKLMKALVRRGIKAESIHGNKDHRKRVRALDAFKRNQVQVLVATDVAARGLDIPAVSHVINYDIPTTYEDYVHRIGRTGRADKKGKALTFIGQGAKPPEHHQD